jgi:Cu/Ag efflux protein CusF
MKRFLSAFSLSVSLIGISMLTLSCGDREDSKVVKALEVATNADTLWSKGVVKDVDHKRYMIVIEHDEISGVSAAVTWPYKTLGDSLLTLVKAGDSVRFILKEQLSGEYKVYRIEKLGFVPPLNTEPVRK